METSDNFRLSFTSDPGNHLQEKEDDIMLDLSLSGPRSCNLFVADQTPTPTRLIRNCEEVGLFEDLQHVNPFEETFRRAVEQNCQHVSGSETLRESEESLHTPKVLSHLEATEDIPPKPLQSPISTAVALDGPNVDDILSDINIFSSRLPTSRQNSANSTTSSQDYGKIRRYRSIAEKPSPSSEPTEVKEQEAPPTGPAIVQLPSTIQLVQPQVITLSFPAINSSDGTSSRKPSAAGTCTAIPVQTVKPFILPKSTIPPSSPKPQAASTLPSLSIAATTTSCPSPPTQSHEPSSASLTPTSQLPIKERLKAIINHNSKMRSITASTLKSNGLQCKRGRTSGGGRSVTSGKYDCDTIERRRAASSRYRNKMRDEHKELRRQNAELLAETTKLRERVRHLEGELAKQRAVPASIHPQPRIGGDQMVVLPTQLQIPPSTVHLVMNIPQLLVPTSGQPVLQQPITYSVEKK